MKKYKLTSEHKTVDGVTLYRIEVVKPFASFNAGDKGGWIEKEANLSQEGSAWVSDNAVVYGNAQVGGDAQVCDNAVVCGNAALAMAKVCVKPYKEGKK